MIEVLEKLWRPVLEILILTVGIYYAASFVRGTRGAAILTGTLVLLLTLGLVSNWLELQVLRWLLPPRKSHSPRTLPPNRWRRWS